jgi:predicted RNA binding protein YcfA (HicA-like mRNA interferase family)
MAKRTQVVGKSKGKSKTKMRMYTTREARKIAERNGWVLARSNGDHWYYKKSGVPKTLTLSEGLNRMVWERVVKEYE